MTDDVIPLNEIGKIGTVKVYNQAYVDKQQKRIEELEKENAELKSENQKWKDEWQEQVQKATDEGYARTLQTIQLTKAKEIIRSLYFIIQGRIDYKGNIPLEDEMYRANQFLNSEVEK